MKMQAFYIKKTQKHNRCKFHKTVDMSPLFEHVLKSLPNVRQVFYMVKGINTGEPAYSLSNPNS